MVPFHNSMIIRAKLTLHIQLHSGNKVSLCGALGSRVTLPRGLVQTEAAIDSPQEIPDLLPRPTSLKRFAMAPVIPKLLVR